jgi:hypothetical protein
LQQNLWLLRGLGKTPETVLHPQMEQISNISSMFLLLELIRYTSVIPALMSLSQEDVEFETTLDYIARPCLTKGGKKMQNQNL